MCLGPCKSLKSTLEWGVKAGERGQVRSAGDSFFISRRALQEPGDSCLKGSLVRLVQTGAKGRREAFVPFVLQVPHLQRR